jgi:branched-chain amino acid transport system permease protein
MNTATLPNTTASEPIPKSRFDIKPVGIVLILMLAAWPLVGSTSTWLTLTIAGLAMGMIVFITA